MAWILWLLLAIGLGAAEAATLTFALGILAGAALVAAVVAGFGAGILIQVLTFGLAGAFGLLVIRPIARRQMHMPAISKDGTDALIGRSAVVISRVGASEGLIKLAGEEWSARSFDETQEIPEGATVEVLEIDGARAVVYPRDLLP